jgi:transposase
VRVTAAFNRMSGIDGATVIAVSQEPGVTVATVRLKRRRHECACGWSTAQVYDRSVRRWRHLDAVRHTLYVQAEVCRIDCPFCERVVTEVVPWARPGARHTRDFEDLVAWHAQRSDKTTVCKLLRITWRTVTSIVERVVADHLDTSRFDGLRRIGVDEISYSGHNYLTVVADHDRQGRVVWVGEGKSAATLNEFYELIGLTRCARLRAVSLDMGAAYSTATTTHAPQARQCIDPFHLIKLANEAINKVRRAVWNQTRSPDEPRGGTAASRWVKHTRWALLKDPDDLTDDQLDVLHRLRRSRSVLYRCWQLKEGLRDLYRLDNPADADRHLDWWLAWACRSRIPVFVTLSRTVRTNRDRILAAVELGLSNSRLEGLNSKIRMINHRAYGHHTPQALTAMIYLCCGGITPKLPHK